MESINWTLFDTVDVMIAQLFKVNKCENTIHTIQQDVGMEKSHVEGTAKNKNVHNFSFYPKYSH